MARYQVTLAYDGALFEGFQRQRRKTGSVRTVQGVVEAALARLGWQGITILSAGRTDTGVHALGQVIAFDLDWLHSVEELQAALNANLPSDVAVQAAQVVSPAFHPRYAALSRRYRYWIYCRPVRNPLLDHSAWRVWPAVELPALNTAAGLLVGTHDFAAFGAPQRKGGSTVRTVQSAGWQDEGEKLVFEIEANAFLYHMVRRLVYAQVIAAQGRLEADAIRSRLAGRNTEPLQGLAPAQGLALVDVKYE